MHSALQLHTGPVVSPSATRADADHSPSPPCTDNTSCGQEEPPRTTVITGEVATAAVQALVVCEKPATPSKQPASLHAGLQRRVSRNNRRATYVLRKHANSLVEPQDSPIETKAEIEVSTESAALDSALVIQSTTPPPSSEANETVECKTNEDEDEKKPNDPTCQSCWSTFPSVNELGIHIKKQHVVNRVCHSCGITSFASAAEFEEHHLGHIREKQVKVKIAVLDESTLPPLPPPRRTVARKRTANLSRPATPIQREPIKLTLRLTTGRQAKIAEERQEAARRAEMLTATERSNTSSPSTKEEALFEKAITELYSDIKLPDKSPGRDSPASSFVLRYSPSPPASTASNDQQSSGSRPNSRPPSTGGPTIAVRSAESLQANHGGSALQANHGGSAQDPDSVLRNMLDTMGSPQPIIQEPEFVSLERLADQAGGLIGSPPTSTVATSSPSTTVVNTHAPAPLLNLAAMQPSSMLPNLLIGASAHMTDPLHSSPIPTSYAPQVPTTYAGQQPHFSSPQNMNVPVYVCDVCNLRWPSVVALDAHRSVSGHFRCAPCNLVFVSKLALSSHGQAVHGQMSQQQAPNSYQPQGNVRNPPPLYRGPVPNTGQNYPTNMPPLIYQQQNYRNGVPPQRPAAPRYDQFRPAPPRPPPPSYLPPGNRQPPPQQVLRHVLQQPPLNQQPPSQATPNKRPPPPNGASPPLKVKRPEIPARQPEDCQIIAVQRGGEGVPHITSVQGSASIPQGATEKPANTIVKLTDEITLSVKPSGAADANKKTPQKSGANVASLLANRGITVTTSNKSKSNDTPTTNSTPVAAPAPVIPESLSMNSSISILPASRNNGNSNQAASAGANGTFAVPRPRKTPPVGAQQNTPERPPRPPTVDLTSDAAMAPRVSPNTPTRRSPLQCSVCQRELPNSAALQQHMQVHHPHQLSSAQQQQAQQKLPYKCPHCQACYPTAQTLNAHRQQMHKEMIPPPPSASDMGIPVVDLRAPGTVDRLTRLGIHHYIPLPSQNNSGYFSIPIVSADMTRNAGVFSLHAMNAASVLQFGPLRSLPR